MSTPVVTIGPGALDFTIARGVSWSTLMTFNALNADGTLGALINFTGITLSMTVRNTATGATVDTLTQGNGLTNGGSAGTVTIARTSTQLATYPESCTYSLIGADVSAFVTGYLAGGIRLQ